jgi:hypothetical protein
MYTQAEVKLQVFWTSALVKYGMSDQLHSQALFTPGTISLGAARASQPVEHIPARAGSRTSVIQCTEWAV